MAKLSRTVLKEIVKECVYEIFEESFARKPFSVSNSQMNESLNSMNAQRQQRQQRPKPQSESQGRQSHLDHISFGSENVVKNEKFDKRIDEVTSNLTSDPVMSSIFQDTARTTLQNQASADSRRAPSMTSGDAAARKVSNSDPTELFAESASKWATLAFAD